MLADQGCEVSFPGIGCPERVVCYSPTNGDRAIRLARLEYCSIVRDVGTQEWAQPPYVPNAERGFSNIKTGTCAGWSSGRKSLYR
jgi:hypothetical protein